MRARQQRVAVPAAARRARGDRARARRRSTATPTRPTRCCASACPSATACPPSRIAIGNGSCDILLAAGEALLEPGAELVYAWPSFSVYPHLAAASGARAVTVAARRATSATTCEAMLREITVATRLVIVCNPNNPTSTALPLARHRRRSSREVPRARVRDPRRGLLRVQPARGPRRLARAARRAPQPRAAAHVLEGLRAVRAARRLRAVRLGGAAARARPGAPAVLLQRARAGRGGRGARPPGRGRSTASRAPSPSASRSTSACARSASSRPSRRRTSAGSRSATSATRQADHAAASPSAACSCAAAARSAATCPRCASPTGCPRRTRASSTRSPRLLLSSRAERRDSAVCRPLYSRTCRLLQTLADDHEPLARTASRRSLLALRRWSSRYAWRFS